MGDRPPVDRQLARDLDWLNSHINLEARKGISAGKVEGLGLETITAVLDMLGAPQLDVPAIHITGTNGKGSTGMLVSRLLETHGFSVGTYASPHLHVLNERIKLNNASIPDETFANTLAAVRLATEHLVAASPELVPSWFELMTASAYRTFSDEAVAFGVIEVGMLGRFDATNVAATEVAVVTNVGKDHTNGDPGWEREVAREKAGIVKPESTLVLGELDPDLQQIFLAEPAAAQLVRNRDFGCLNHQIAVGGRVLDVRTPRGIYNEVFLSLHGSFQVDNAVLAMVAAEEAMDSALDDEALAEAFGSANMPARLEVVAHNPLIIIDGAHNPSGAEAMATALDEEFQSLGSRFLLVGMMDEKDPVEMLEALGAGRADLVVCCQPDWPRALPAATLGEAAESLGCSTEVITSPVEALSRLVALAGDDDMIIVAGSLYVAGAVRGALVDLAEEIVEES